ncbi:conserved unknown protein [Ectocarpus siliculosus]|uniref:3'-5' exonuclease n=1 Tax=Ectocarpus siliculosus TaxID=2880 RepID=D7G3Q9_ECTSI|nr:conserved unknown protein [Ectocarpus siliculosus]|eukprot:CBJ33586.1 conserved unknown protein [Ectocarpus siliculosus]
MREAYMNSYMMQYHSYVSLVNRCRRSIGGHVRAAAEEGAPDIPTFGGFGDKEGFNGAWPSDQYLRAVWHKWFYDTVVIEADGVRMTREDYLQRVGQLVDGMVLAGDASFKYAKVIRLTSAGESTKSKPIQGIFTILNEYEQAAEGGAELAALTFPEGKTGVRVFDKTAIDIAVANLVGGCATQGMVLGMDCEWEPAFNGSSERPVCTLQLALPDGTSSLFHLQRGGRGITPSTFNTNLKRLLGDLAITKVGVAVKGDGKRLQRDYDVETRGMVDLRSYARACWVDLPCRSLAGMTATALGKYLSKDAAGRFSHWSRPELTPNQIEYACLDAYAAVLLHAEIGKFKDPIFGEAPSEVPAAGTKTEEEATSLLEKWGTVLTLGGRVGTRSGGLQRVVVKVDNALKPSSFVPHDKAPPPAQDGQRRVTVKDVVDGAGFVLWDIVHVRLASAHRSFEGTPLPGGAADADAHQDDFFDAPRPAQAVYQNGGDVESDLEADSESDDDTFGESGAGADLASSEASSGGPSASGAGADAAVASQEEAGDMFFVRLDLFHALNRLSRTIKKGHGAFRPIMARLRDACFLVNRDDVLQIEKVLERRGMSPAQVQQAKDQDWSYFLRKCRRLVPPPSELLKRFDKVVQEFGNCVDNISKEVLLRPKSMKAVSLLRKHIVAGCLSDPDGVAMYYAVGKTTDGLVNYRCVRGTNDVEGYHRYLRTLLASYCASPALAQSVLLEFNFRWNLKMMVKNRGLPAELGEHYNQHLVEIIQRATELPRLLAMASRRRFSGHRREEWARPELGGGGEREGVERGRPRVVVRRSGRCR